MSDRTEPDGPSGGKTERLARYLRTEVERSGGVMYVKGRSIADDVDLSPQEIGSILSDLQDAALDLEVEKWAYTTATTWRISAN